MVKKVINLDTWLTYGVDIARRTIDLTDDIANESVSLVIRAMMKMIEVNSKEPIHLFINSFGGSVYDGIALVDFIEVTKTPIYTYAIGCVMSMGTIIYLMGDYRYSFKRTTFMIHSVSDEVEGKAFQIKTDTKEVNRINNLAIDILAIKTNKTKKFWSKEIQYEDRYYDAIKSLKFGIIDEILEEFKLGE